MEKVCLILNYLLWPLLDDAEYLLFATIVKFIVQDSLEATSLADNAGYHSHELRTDHCPLLMVTRYMFTAEIC